MIQKLMFKPKELEYWHMAVQFYVKGPIDLPGSYINPNFDRLLRGRLGFDSVSNVDSTRL